MDRRILIAAVFVLLAQFVNAQRFHGGLTAGVAASQVSGDNLSGFNKAGLYAGGFVNVVLSEKSALQLEMYYIQKGSRKNQRPKVNDYTVYKLNLQYIEMPLLYRWQFSRRFSLYLGPALGVLVKNTEVEKDEAGLLPNRPSFHRFDLNVVLGLGISISDHFRVIFRGQNSVLPIRNYSGNALFRLDRLQYNTTLILSLAYEI